jgi:tetratricopeptide (TPR) repeat protein
LAKPTCGARCCARSSAAIVCLVRSRLREQLGDLKGAEQDFAEGLRQTPVDAPGWIDRGLAKESKQDWAGALADFAAAARCNPRMRQAIHNQAYVLGEQLKNPAEAIVLLDRELELYPKQPDVIVARGVYHSQLQHRDLALADVRRAAAMAPREGEVLYRIACIYAQLSQDGVDRDGDRRQAIAYLARALEAGFGYEYLEADKDLDPLQNHPGFAELRKVVESTKKLKRYPL